jgi:pyruvate formate lyase activating enzyme
MKEALFYRKIDEKKVICELCPHRCFLNNSQVGRCGIRKNIDGRLITKNYGILSALNLDPIEKKPFYHFYPGKNILSMGSIGCNMGCPYCQNYEIAKEFYKTPIKESSPEGVLKNYDGFGIAFTYNEPTVYYEFMLDMAKYAKNYSKKTVMVTNGLIEKIPLLELIPYVDAFSVDLKGFTQGVYSQLGGILEGVKSTLKLIVSEKKHLEIEFLLVPGINDNKEEFLQMVTWIKKELNPKIPLHINRYYPNYKLNTPPPSKDLLLEYYNLAKDYLQYVYIGNANIDIDTICSCGNIAIERDGWGIKIKGLDRGGNCKKCGEKVAVM